MACSLEPKSKDAVVPEPEAEETHDGAEENAEETPKPGDEKFEQAPSPSENCEQAVAQAPSQSNENGDPSPMLQLLTAGTHKWVDEDTLMQAPWLCEDGSKPKHPTTREQARSQSKETEYEELRKVLTDGIYMLVFPWSVVRDHREDITALMRDDSAPTKSGGSKPK